MPPEVALADYLPILTLIALVVLFVALSFTASILLAPQRTTTAKRAAYESGIVPEVGPAQRVPVKFYLVAIAFIVLDVEIVFLYPYSLVMREFGTYGLVLMGVFLLVLLVPFGYLLSSGALAWGSVKKMVTQGVAPVKRVSDVPSFERRRGEAA